MIWEPLDRETLETWIADALVDCGDEVRAAWARIRIGPEKWRCSPWGDDGGGFWAVAIDGDEVLWFNDIEDGFCRGVFRERGVIDQYSCSQLDFDQVLERFAHELGQRPYAGVRSTEVPTVLGGPGIIVKRQTTYWDLRAATGATVRVHLRAKAEARYSGADYPAAELVTGHPLLAAYTQPGASLFFSGRSIRPADLAADVERAVHAASAGWRSLADHDTSAAAVANALASGHGLLLCAPEATCAAVAAVLEAAGVSASVLVDTPIRGARQVLLLGTSFLIAEAFAFERLA